MQQTTPFVPIINRKATSRLLLLAVAFILSWLLLPSYQAEAVTDCNSVAEIPVGECQALVALYNSTNGPGWINQENWLVTSTPCSWYGVSCLPGPMPQHVTDIYLYSNGLAGGIPAEIGNLTNLHGLYLSQNQLGSVPAEIGNLPTLQDLYLDANQLSGLPAEIGNLSTLQELDLSKNQLGTLPAEIGNLLGLRDLYLSENQLNSVPATIGNLSSLGLLVLSHNQLSSVPPELGNLSSLQYLYLDDNQLSSVPAELGNLSSLQELYLSSNQLSTLPAEVGDLSSLGDLHLSNNQLSSVPAEIGDLATLHSLDLSNNQLSDLPPGIGNITSLYSLDLSDNQLRNIPPGIGNLDILDFLDLRSNRSIARPLPPGLVRLVALNSLHFSDTNICEPGDAAFQGWLANIPDLTRTSMLCPTVTIIKDAQPNSWQNFHFQGDLGNFHLDDASPDDRDPFSRSQTFTVGAGTYLVSEQVPSSWQLTGISCDPAANSVVDLANSRVTITVASDNHVTCTFTNLD